MEEIKKGEENTQAAPAEVDITDPKAVAQAQEEAKKVIREELEKRQKAAEEANEALKQGKGILHLETPIRARDADLMELKYDFTTLKGYDFTDAMDSDPKNSANTFTMTRRQALALFAKAAAKQTEGLDMQDIIERIGIMDSVAASEIASLFFIASRKAGRMRISKL